MNIGTFIYLFILFVVFSPGVLFSIPSSFIPSTKKTKWIQVCIHGFLFSVVWLLTHKTVYNLFNMQNVREGVNGSQTVIGADTVTVKKNVSVSAKKEDISVMKPPKCFKHPTNGARFCVSTRTTNLEPDKQHNLCLGATNGCLWSANNPNKCNTDQDCIKEYNVNEKNPDTFPQFVEKSCTNNMNDNSGHDWRAWTCNNVK